MNLWCVTLGNVTGQRSRHVRSRDAVSAQSSPKGKVTISFVCLSGSVQTGIARRSRRERAHVRRGVDADARQGVPEVSDTSCACAGIYMFV